MTASTLQTSLSKHVYPCVTILHNGDPKQNNCAVNHASVLCFYFMGHIYKHYEYSNGKKCYSNVAMQFLNRVVATINNINEQRLMRITC